MDSPSLSDVAQAVAKCVPSGQPPGVFSGIHRSRGPFATKLLSSPIARRDKHTTYSDQYIANSELRWVASLVLAPR